MSLACQLHVPAGNLQERGCFPVLRTGLKAWLGAAAVHEGVVSIAAGERREAGRREHVRGVQEGAAEAVADQVLRVQRIIAPVCGLRLRFLRTQKLRMGVPVLMTSSCKNSSKHSTCWPTNPCRWGQLRGVCRSRGASMMQTQRCDVLMRPPASYIFPLIDNGMLMYRNSAWTYRSGEASAGPLLVSGYTSSAVC